MYTLYTIIFLYCERWKLVISRLFTVYSVIHGNFNAIREWRLYIPFSIYWGIYIYPIEMYQKNREHRRQWEQPHYQNGTSSCADSVKPLGISTFSAIMHTQFDSIPAILARRVRLCESVHSLPCRFAHDRNAVELNPAFDISLSKIDLII